MNEQAIASAGATVANFGPGFDVLGLCLEGPRDTVTAELTDDGEVRIIHITGDDGRLPWAAHENCAGVAARHVLDRFARPGTGVKLWLDKGLPLGSGMGSSAASAVAGAVATAALVDPSIPKEALIDAAREGERIAAGSPHADNVAPSLLGGLVACLPGPHGDEQIDIVRLPLPTGLVLAVAKPSYGVRTADARACMPQAIPLGDAVHNLGAMAGLVAALAAGDLPLVGRCLTDRIATPYRKGLIGGYDDIVAAALRAGAIGAGISGSGPTIFALCAGRMDALDVADALVEAFAAAGAEATAMVSATCEVGADVRLG